MTTDDLRTRAREAAAILYADPVKDSAAVYTRHALRYYQRGAYEAGYLAHAAQQPTLDVDELVMVLHDAACVCDRTTHPAESWVNWTNYARAVVAHLTKGNENDE